MVDIQLKQSKKYIERIEHSGTEAGCEFFATRAKSAINEAMGFHKEWIRRQSNDDKGIG